jgi:uncharacterized membrane protein YgcG
MTNVQNSAQESLDEEDRLAWEQELWTHRRAFYIPVIGVVAVLIVFIIASFRDSAGNLVASALTAISTLTAAVGGHAAGALGTTRHGRSSDTKSSNRSSRG